MKRLTVEGGLAVVQDNSIFLMSGQSREEGRKNHESLVYYVPALNIKSWEALKFDTEGLPEDWSLVIWNIKQFDRYNALFGIKAGDRLLKYIVDWLKKQTDPTYIYRMPGVWLGILLPNSEIPWHLRRKEQLLSEQLPNLIDYHLYVDSIEIPLPLCGDMEQLMRYISYLFGKSRGDFTSRHIVLSVRTKKQMELEANLVQLVLKKLKEEEFQAYFQPIEYTNTKRCEKCEVLARLYDKEYGWISPREFIPILEINGLIHELDCFILREACKMIRCRKNKGMPPIQFHVNISAQEFMREDLLQSYLKIINGFDIDHSLLQMEITETAMLRSPEYSIHIMREFRKRGIRFSMDDFGTGYSNFIGIATLPVSEVKLDKSFLDTMRQSNTVRVMYDDLLAMFRKMKLLVVAEGVETAEQYRYLVERHVDYLQGYYISRPLSKMDFMQFSENSLLGIGG